MTEISGRTFSLLGHRIFSRGMHQMGVAQDPVDEDKFTKETPNEVALMVGCD